MARTLPVLVPDPRDPDPTLRVAQAAGMVSAQVSCSMKTAIILIERRAALIGCSIEDLAAAVIKRRIRWDGYVAIATPPTPSTSAPRRKPR
jgi:hypothetical protein